MAQIETVKILTLVGTGILGIGLVLHIVGLATPKWEVISFPGQGVIGYYGLWTECSPIKCHAYNDKTSDIIACEAFAIIGMLLGAGGLGFALLHLLTLIRGMPKNLIFSVFSVFAGCLALGTIIIAVFIWGVRLHLDVYARLVPSGVLGYSFILSIVGGVLMAFGGVLMIFASKQ